MSSLKGLTKDFPAMLQSVPRFLPSYLNFSEIFFNICLTNLQILPFKLLFFTTDALGTERPENVS